MQALQLCEAILRDNTIAADRRAIPLCWYFHLVGDIHQPLHAVSVFSTDFPVAQYPDGDRGGNREAVNDNGRRTTLHSLWDSYPGTSSVPSTAAKRVTEWASDPELSRANLSTELGVMDYSAWADESRALALSIAYRNGTIRGANDELLKEGQSVVVPALPQGYDDDALAVVHTRIFLAGHRLADKLKDVLH